MLILGIAFLVMAIVVLWICLPGKDSKMKLFLRYGGDTLAAIAITSGICVGITVIIVSLSR